MKEQVLATGDAANAVRVREARADDPADGAFLAALAPRLEEGMPPWIDPGTLAAAVERSVGDALAARGELEVILIAEDGRGRRLGFIYALSSSDNLPKEPRVYISEFAVAREAEGRGVGRALIAAVEDWARERGAWAVTLEVFAGNSRARVLYERIGFEPMTLHLRKPL